MSHGVLTLRQLFLFNKCNRFCPVQKALLYSYQMLRPEFGQNLLLLSKIFKYFGHGKQRDMKKNGVVCYKNKGVL